LLSAAPAGREKGDLDLRQMRESAARDRFGEHSVVAAADGAELILFVETSDAAGPYFEDTLRHPVYREHRERSYLFCSTDRFVPMLPGVFASVERRWYWPSWTRAGHYLGVAEREGLRFEPDAKPGLLFSFLGSSSTHPVRARVLGLRHLEALLFDATVEEGEVARGERSAPDAAERTERYAGSLRDSAFVLCPRGGGTSSFRLFEAMMMGRAPVIVSDETVLPEGPRWEEFSVRVAEDRVDEIPALLEARRTEAAEMGAAARRAWLDWFSPEVGFHRTVERCLELAARSSSRRGLRRYSPFLQLARPYHAARFVRKRLPG
jgi:hypothetical protein